MELKDYLIRKNDGEDSTNIILSASNEVEKALLNKYIISYLNLKDVVEEVISKNKIDNLKISFKIHQNNEANTWTLRSYATKEKNKKAYSKSRWSSSGWYSDGDESEVSYYGNPLENQAWNKCSKLNSSYKHYNEDQDKYEQEQINKINTTLSNASEHIVVPDFSWFGKLQKYNLSFTTPNDFTPNFEEYFLGDLPLALLKKTTLDIEMPVNELANKEPTKKLKI